MNLVKYCILLAALVFASSVLGNNNPQKGKLTGYVIDAETSEPLPGANIVVVGTNFGTATNVDGIFEIAIMPGKYDLACSMIGYEKQVKKELNIEADEIQNITFILKMAIIAGEEIVVEAKVNRNNDAILLKDRREAMFVSDAVSAETMVRTGASDAASAMSRVTGATIVDGKYVYMRGLGDRYGITQLNGATLPSTDPDRQAVQMDMIPVGMLENIVTTKTATPDQPGNFAGGAVNISTKNFPDGLAISFATTSSFNTQTSFSDDFLSYSPGKSDWQAKDDGTRALPKEIADPAVTIPDISAAWLDADAAQKLDQLSKAFNPEMAPRSKSVPLNQGYSFSFADNYRIFGRPAGFVSSIVYNHNFKSYTDGIAAQYKLTGQVNQTITLSNDYLFSDAKSSSEVNWSGMGKVVFQPVKDHNLSLNAMVNRSGESVARYINGALPRDLSENDVYESRVLRYTERRLRTLQIRGDHTFPAFKDLKIDWMTTRAVSLQDEPDLRFFTDDYNVRENGGQIDTTYGIRRAIYPAPTRYFRYLEEKSFDSKIDITLPLHYDNLNGRFKIGGSRLGKDRTFTERRFEVRQDAIRYDGSENFFSRSNMGINTEKSGGRLTRFNNYIVDATQLSGNYSGDQQVGALYGMLDIALTSKIRLIGGSRYETTEIDVASQDTTKATGRLQEKDWLPSLNMAYELSGTTKLRAAYGKTLARPTFRELAPYASYEFVNDYIFVGNPELERTIIDNFDLRWEKYSRPGELYSIGGYYKKFTNPIERVINPVAGNPEVQFRNVKEARLVGAEFEVKKKLDFLTSKLNNFRLGANLSLIYSAVQIADDELAHIRSFDANAPDKRPLLGQSDYVINGNLSYDNYRSGTMISIYYNVFGKRLSEVAIGGTPDIYEASRHIFDINLSQKIWNGITLGITAKNLLNSKVKKLHTFNDKEYIVNQYSLGRSFSLKLNYSILR